MLATVPASPVPSISIHFAAEELPVPEPASPFDRIAFNANSPKSPSPLSPSYNKEDGMRSTHLLPPPVLSPKQAEHQQQLRAVKERAATGGAGLDQARFQALLQASRSPAGTNKALDLRKEVAWKAHKSKQLERRALFLSKIDALPSPTAASMPVTPPESPAVFHFTLPSPGLISPLALFETLERNQAKYGPPPVRVEQVDFRAKARKEAEMLAKLTGNVGMSMKLHGLAGDRDIQSKDTTNGKGRKGLPSLDDISKRLGGNVTVTRAEPATASPQQTSTKPAPSANRLPAFLKRASVEVKNEVVEKKIEAPKEEKIAPAPPTKVAPPTPAAAAAVPVPAARPRMQNVGRLAFAPVPGVTRIAEVPQPTAVHGPISRPTTDALRAPQTHAAAFRPRQERPSSLSSLEALATNSMTGNHVASQKAPTPLTAEALQQLARRTERGNVMVERLKRRVSAPGDMKAQTTTKPLQQQQQQTTRNIRGGF